MGKSCDIACNGASMAKTGNAVPTMEKLSTPHSEQILIDIRMDGSSPKMNTLSPCEAMTARTDNSNILQ